MSTSRLQKQDDEYYYLSCYLRNDPDEYPRWMTGPNGEVPDPALPQHIVEADHYALYEVRVDYRIRKSDGEVFLDGIR